MKGDLRTLDDDGCKKNHFQQHRLNKDIIAAEVPQPPHVRTTISVGIKAKLIIQARKDCLTAYLTTLLELEGSLPRALPFKQDIPGTQNRSRLRDRIHQIAESLTTDTLRLSTLPPVSHHHLRKLDHAHYRCSSLAYSVTDNGVPIHNLTFYSPPTAPHFDIMQKHLKSLKMGGDNPTWGLLSDIDIQRLYDMAEKGEELVRLSGAGKEDAHKKIGIGKYKKQPKAAGLTAKGGSRGLAVDVVERDAAGLKGSAEEVLYRYSEMV